MAVVKKRGYVPNASARALVSRNSRLIAACLLAVKGANPLEDPYNAQFLGALVNETRARGYDLMLRFVESFDEATRGIRSWNADGAVFNGLPDRHIRALEEQHPVPIVFTDCYTSARQVNCVGIDDTKGGRLAAAYLLSHGHRRFAFCGFYQAERGRHAAQAYFVSRNGARFWRHAPGRPRLLAAAHGAPNGACRLCRTALGRLRARGK